MEPTIKDVPAIKVIGYGGTFTADSRGGIPAQLVILSFPADGLRRAGQRRKRIARSDSKHCGDDGRERETP